MADRRRRVKQGLGAVLRRTAPPQSGASAPALEPEAQPQGPATAPEELTERQAAPEPQPQESARPRVAQPAARQRAATAPGGPQAGAGGPEPLPAPGTAQQPGSGAAGAARPHEEAEALTAGTETLTAEAEALTAETAGFAAVAPATAPPAPGAAAGRSGGWRRRPRSVTMLHPPEPKRHTSVYLYPAEFDMLDDLIYDLRRQHGVRLPKTELLRALLHLAHQMLQDPEGVEELLAVCRKVMEE